MEKIPHELRLVRFIETICPRILLLEFQLRRRVQKLRPDAYAAALRGNQAPMLGELIRTIETEQLQEAIIPDFAMDFRRYDPKNHMRTKGRGRSGRKAYRHVQISAALWLFRNIRNGAFHGNDILSPRLVGGRFHPPIFTQVISENNRINASVLPENIERFLADFAALVKPKFWEEFA